MTNTSAAISEESNYSATFLQGHGGGEVERHSRSCCSVENVFWEFFVQEVTREVVLGRVRCA